MKRILSLFSVLCLLSSVALAAATKGAEPLRISQGGEVTLTDYLVPGKTVVFDFTSKFCGPCRLYDEPLHDLHTRRADVVVIKVDVNRPDVQGIDWESPVVRQFDLRSIPHFKVYSPQGKLLAEDKLVIGPDGRPDRARSSSAGRKMVDDMIKQSQ
jgi:thiol-disulfide isomerase/thioredoxin